MTTNAQFWAEVIETTILQFGIFALKDMSNVGAKKFLPLGLSFLIFGLSACFGFETDYTMNFARDFGPRLMSYMVGYGPQGVDRRKILLLGPNRRVFHWVYL